VADRIGTQEQLDAAIAAVAEAERTVEFLTAQLAAVKATMGATIAELQYQLGQALTRAECAEAEVRQAEFAIADLVKALDRERALNAAQCREADRG
jgi:hypothetical protein